MNAQPHRVGRAVGSLPPGSPPGSPASGSRRSVLPSWRTFVPCGADAAPRAASPAQPLGHQQRLAGDLFGERSGRVQRDLPGRHEESFFSWWVRKGEQRLQPQRLNGAPDTIRTCDFCLRRAALYPTELRAHPGRIIAGCPARLHAAASDAGARRL